MKEKILFLLAFLLPVIVAKGETIDVNDLRYSLNDDGNATLTSCLSTDKESIVIPSSVSDGSRSYKVTRIGDYAFDQHKEVTSVSFPNTLEYMGFCSFRYCYGLTSVTIPASLKELSSSNFSQCINLESVTIASGSKLTKVGEAAFYNCNKLPSITLPSTVKEIGPWAFHNCTSFTSFTLPSSLEIIRYGAFHDCKNITSITIPSKVTTIEYDAFVNCSSLTSITIPSTVTSLGTYTFSGCTSLSSVTLPNNMTTIPNGLFYECTNLQSVSIPSGVTQIGEKAFYGCKSLTSMSLPSQLTEIPTEVFCNCSNLQSVNIPSGVTRIGSNAFYGCTVLSNITFPSNLSEIAYGAFQYCDGLTSINLPASVTKIGNYAFRYCDGITSITIPATATNIGEYVFSNCENLTTVTIQNGVTTLQRDLFSYCPKLQTVNLPSSLTSIGRGVFYQCTSLSEISLPSNLTEIGTYAFSRTAIEHINIPSKVSVIGEYAFESCKQLLEITIPNGVTEIKNNTFKSCSALQSVNLPSTVTKFGDSAFSECSSLQSINIPSQLTTIGPYAFYYCTSLEGDITLPQTVTSIQYYAFYNCDKITSFVCPTALSQLGESVLSECDNLETVVFPKNMKDIPGTVCYNCPKLINIIFPEDVETIGRYAFYNCGKTGTLTIPSTVKTIGDHSFYRAKMTHLVLPEGLQEIKSNAFQSCESLQEVVLPSSLTKIEEKAFDDCDNLFEVVFPSDVSNMTFGNSVFSYNKNLRKITFPKTGMTTIPYGMFNECDRLRNVELPSTITTICQYAFSGCDSLQTLYIPDGVTEIQYNAFRSCKKLKYLRLPNTLQTLGDECLSYCESLQFLNIPASVTYVGNWSVHTTATSSNTNFKSMGVLAATMPSTKDHVFWQYQPAFSLLVLSGQESDYQNSSSWTPDAQDNRTIIGYPSAKQTLTQDKIHLSVLETETYIQGGPEAVYVDWFEGMGNYRVYYTDSKGNKTTNLPMEIGSYKISLVFEEGPYYKAATFNNIATFEIKDIADEDFALLWDFYNQTYDWTGKKSTWSGNNWKLVEGRKETAVGIFGVKWNNGHVEEINFGRGTNIYNLNATETPLSLFCLPNVKKIEMVNVGLYGDIGQKVEDYLASGKTLSPTLEHLDIYNNQLEGNISTLANAIPALKYLDASQNKFSTLYPALPETLETVDISKQNITDIVATVDLRNMTEEGFFSTLPSIIFYDPATRTYAEDIKINVQSQTNWATFDLSYQGDNDFTVTGSPTWKGASGDIAKCSYRDASNKTTNFNAYFFYDMGDVNFNGEVDVLDLQQSINYVLRDGYGNYYRYNFTAGDLNADNAINVLDIVPHVDMLLSMNKPTTIEAKSRGEEDASEVCEAKLYVKNGYLMMESVRDVAALDLILDNVDEGQVSMLQNSMTCVKKSLDGKRVHVVIYSTGGKVLPAGEISLARLSDDGSVVYAKLSDDQAEAVSVSLNNANAPIATDIQSISDDDIIYDEGTSWEIHTPDGMLISKGIGKPERDMTRRGIYILTIKDEKGVVIKSMKMRGSFSN